MEPVGGTFIVLATFCLVKSKVEHEGWYPKTWVLPAPWGGVVFVGYDAAIRSNEEKDNEKDKEKKKAKGIYFLWSVPTGLCRAVMF